MKLISWNVNGLRACYKKGFLEFLKIADADVFCVQETKMQSSQSDFDFRKLGYYEFWNSAQRKGYSGTLVLSRKQPNNVKYGIGVERHDKEGRVINVEFEHFTLINVYTPNSQAELARLAYRQDWEECFREYVANLQKHKPVIICGDLNVAHKEIDLKNPKSNRHNPGFSDEEREEFDKLLELGFTDSFRYLYPERRDAYTWWSYMGRARENNSGWRIDYFIVSNDIAKSIQDAEIHHQIYGSDHCPVSLCVEIN